MTQLDLAIPSTSPLVPKLGESLVRAKLVRMLRSTLQRFPKASLVIRKGEYGVSLDDETYLTVSFSATLNAEPQRDLLVLLATWLVADPDRLLNQSTPQGG